MKKRLTVLLAVALAQGAATAQTSPLARMEWLAGCWASANGEPGGGEQWSSAAGGMMIGSARTLRQGVVRQFEFMLLRETPQGLVFIAWPNGKGETHFPAERVEVRSASFANPGHDFPQRVVYELSDEQTLDARIEGQLNGQLRVVRFPMKRKACPL